MSTLQGGPWQAANADRIAALVDLSASEVRELLREGADSQLPELAERLRGCLRDLGVGLTAGLDEAGAGGPAAVPGSGSEEQSLAEQQPDCSRGPRHACWNQAWLLRMLNSLEEEVDEVIGRLEGAPAWQHAGDEGARGRRGSPGKVVRTDALQTLSDCLLDDRLSPVSEEHTL
jgi:hypothetical protein